MPSRLRVYQRQVPSENDEVAQMSFQETNAMDSYMWNRIVNALHPGRMQQTLWPHYLLSLHIYIHA